MVKYITNIKIKLIIGAETKKYQANFTKWHLLCIISGTLENNLIFHPPLFLFL